MRTLPALAFCLFAVVPALRAADWPQWQGPARDNISKESGLLRDWPRGGPRLLWTYSDAGSGYSGPAVVGHRLYTLGGDGRSEHVFALDVTTGKRIWSTPVGPMLRNAWGGGPRSTPTVDGKRLYVLGGTGNLVCLNAADGKKVWGISLTRDLGGNVPRWGYAESPLIDGDRVICSPGGGRGGMAALNKKDGKLVWQSAELTDDAAYSSAVVAEAGGVRQYVQMTMDGVVGVRAKDGKLLWRDRLGSNNIAVVATPIVRDNLVYVTSDYGSGCGLLELTADGQGGTKARRVYTSRAMQNHHGGVVLLDGHVYGCSGNSNGRTRWVCQEFRTGREKWSDSGFQAGSVTVADGLLYCYGQDDGTVALVQPSPDGWKEKGRLRIPRETRIRSPRGRIWTHPVVANGRLYLRDQDLIFCYDIRANGD